MFKPDGDKWRRVVASPEPKRIFELRPIKWLLEHNTIVIAAGGGGIPTMYERGDDSQAGRRRVRHRQGSRVGAARARARRRSLRDADRRRRGLRRLGQADAESDPARLAGGALGDCRSPPDRWGRRSRRRAGSSTATGKQAAIGALGGPRERSFAGDAGTTVSARRGRTSSTTRPRDDAAVACRRTSHGRRDRRAAEPRRHGVHGHRRRQHGRLGLLSVAVGGRALRHCSRSSRGSSWAMARSAWASTFARLARTAPATGGPYAYTRMAYGDFAGFLVAWGYWISIWASLPVIAVAFAGLAPQRWCRRSRGQPARSASRSRSAPCGSWSPTNLRGVKDAGLFAVADHLRQARAVRRHRGARAVLRRRREFFRDVQSRAGSRCSPRARRWRRSRCSRSSGSSRRPCRPATCVDPAAHDPALDAARHRHRRAPLRARHDRRAGRRAARAAGRLDGAVRRRRAPDVGIRGRRRVVVARRRSSRRSAR